MARVTVEINPLGNKSEGNWGYYVHSDLKGLGTIYHVEALEIEGHYLLREKFSNRTTDYFDPFGIKDKEDQDQADKIMLGRARKHANKTLEELVPELRDNTIKEK